jgi:DNA invertase Pin-like site-specific DNA recombinase
MLEKSKQGKIVARPPFGYKMENGNLIEDMENSENVRLIFKEFAEGNSLNQIAKTYGISVNGIKKILKNFAYLGKVKFDSQISQGTHKPLISAELFNRVQAKFEASGKNREITE